MIQSRLTPKEICTYFEKAEVQVHVSLMVDKMDKQGITQLFINPKALYELACELRRERAITEDEFDLYAVDLVNEQLHAHISKKLCELMKVRDDVSADNISVMTGLQAAAVFNSKNAHVLFSWLAEFVYPFKVTFSEYIKRVQERDSEEEEESMASRSWSIMNGFWKTMDKRMERLMEMYDAAIPCGMLANADTAMWKYLCYSEFKTFDISAMMGLLDYDRYYAVTYKHAPTYENYLNVAVRDSAYSNVSPSEFRGKADFKKDIDSVFKLMVFDTMLNEFFDVEEFFEVDRQELVSTAVSKRPMWVAFMYIIAMMYVNRSEHDRLSKLARAKSDAPWGNVMPE